MPIYTYKREDGTTFDIRQKFSDDALTVDPETGQKVHRVPQAAGIMFKGSGFYVTDNGKAKKSTASTSSSTTSDSKGSSSSGDSSSTKPEPKSDSKSAAD